MPCEDNEFDKLSVITSELDIFGTLCNFIADRLKFENHKISINGVLIRAVDSIKTCFGTGDTNTYKDGEGQYYYSNFIERVKTLPLREKLEYIAMEIDRLLERDQDRLIKRLNIELSIEISNRNDLFDAASIFLEINESMYPFRTKRDKIDIITGELDAIKVLSNKIASKINIQSFTSEPSSSVSQSDLSIVDVIDRSLRFINMCPNRFKDEVMISSGFSMSPRLKLEKIYDALCKEETSLNTFLERAY